MACEVPERWVGAASIAITPYRDIGPYRPQPIRKPTQVIQTWVPEKYLTFSSGSGIVVVVVVVGVALQQ